MKLIQINSEHYIIVDDSEIKEGDWHLKNDKLITRSYIIDENCKKIAHSTEPLEDYTRADGKKIKVYVGINPLNLFEVKELIGEVDVEKKAAELAHSKRIKFQSEFEDGVCSGLEEGYYLGYNQALEDNKEKKYTEEDLRIAITQAFLSGVERLEDFEKVEKMILENTKPKTEWEVEIIDGKLKLK